MAQSTNPITGAARLIYSQTVLAELAKMAMPLQGFTTDFSADAQRPGETIIANFATSSEVKESFPGYLKFTGDDKDAEVKIDIDLSTGFTLDEQKLMSRGSAYIQENARLNVASVVNALVKKVVDDAMSTKATQSVTVSSKFGVDDLATIYAKLIAVGIDPQQATMALSGADYATLASSLPYNISGRADNPLMTGNIGTAIGLKSIICAPTLESNGFVADPSALMIVGRAVPMTKSSSGAGFNREYLTDPTTGMTLSMTEALDNDTGSTVYSVRFIGGVNIANPKALVKLARA